MSSGSEPISAERFALAIADLPLSNVYAKASEIRNSIAHLQHSNDQLKPEADAGDRDCAEARQENIEVIGRMNERLQLLKMEVERRGYNWDEGRPIMQTANEDAMEIDGLEHAPHTNGISQAQTASNPTNQPASNTASNRDPVEADMLALLAERLRDSDEHGLHL